MIPDAKCQSWPKSAAFGRPVAGWRRRRLGACSLALAVVALALAAAARTHCDDTQAASASQPPAATPTTAASMPANATSSVAPPLEYRQQPMPAERPTDAKTISYDVRHEQAATATPLNSTAAASKPPAQRVVVGQLVSSLNEQSDEPLAMSASEQNGADTALNSEPLLVAAAAHAGPAHEPAEEAAAPADRTMDEHMLEQPESLVGRQGRATGPKQSRLSAYVPSFSLANSRPHSPADQMGATPLQLATTTTTTSTPAPPPPARPFDPIIVCYLGSWATYRPAMAKYTPENINPFLCTHIIYAFAGLSSKYELKPFDSYNDITQGGYRRFTSLKEHNKQLKTLIAVGGWNEGSARFSKLVASPELRANFVSSAIRFLREHKFDGIDLDWEYPGYRDGSSQDDRARYAQLIKELRIAFDKDKEQHPSGNKLLLSVAVPAGQDNIDNGFDVPTISKNVDFMNVLTYDYYTAYDKQTNHHAPLTIRDQTQVDANTKRLNIDWTIGYYLSLGAEPHKLIVGVPTYGRSYSLAQSLDAPPSNSAELTPERIGLGARADGPGEEGVATREKGYLAYYEICQKLDQDQWHGVKFAGEHQGPVAFKGNQWVSYDDLQSVIMKTEYVIKRRLGGVMVWTLDNDDFRGSCPSSKGRENPLITAIRDTIIKSVLGTLPSTTTTSTTTSTTTTSTTTTTTTTPAPPGDESANELAVSGSNEQATTMSSSGGAASEQSPGASSLIRSLAEGAQQSNGPTTPEPSAAFACKDEGFFPNPKDCKKYFWCLDSGQANLGLVAHAFTCPSGLFFNQQTEGCDYPEKVTCGKRAKTQTSTSAASSSTTSTTTSTTTPRPAAAEPPQRDNSIADSRSRLVVRKKSRPSPAATTTTTTTTSTTPSPVTASSSSVPVTTDINELVASMLQNPQFVNVINNQLRLNGNNINANSNNQPPQQRHQPQSSASGGGGGGDSAASSLESANGDSSDSEAAATKQAQDLLQLLNLIQSLGGVDKIAPSLVSQANGRGTTATPTPGDSEQAAGGSVNPTNSLFFSYNQPQNQGAGGEATAPNSNAELSAEIMNNIAQLESLFAYNQRQNSAGPLMLAGGGTRPVESQLFTLEDAKVPADQRQPQATRAGGDPMIRVRVPEQRGFVGQQQQQQRAGNAAGNRQRTRGQQPQATTRGSAQFNPNNYADALDFQLPYLEGDQPRQPVGQRIQRVQPQAQLQQQPQTRFQEPPTFSQPQPQSRRPQQQQQQQQFLQPVQRSRGNNQFQVVNDQPATAVASNMRQQFLSTQGDPAAVSERPQQQRRRPPNRDRGQRLNSVDFPPATRARSLVLFTAGPPAATPPSDRSTPAPANTGSFSEGLSSLSDAALEERLRLLESGLISPASLLDETTTSSSAGRSRQQESTPTTTTTTEDLNSPSSSAAQSVQPTASSTSSGIALSSFLGANGGETADPTTDISGRESSDAVDSLSSAAPAFSFSSAPSLESSSVPSAQSEGTEAATGSSDAPPASGLIDLGGPGASFDTQTGRLVCNRRGVFAHPNSCGQFIVCAPKSRSQASLRPFEHHCPAEHIFHDSWGRCRPKSLQADVSKFCPDA